VRRLLTVFKVTESDWVRRKAFLSLLSYRFFQPLPTELSAAVDAIAADHPELENALSDGFGRDFYLVALAG
jgi:hypothetical protein